MIGGNVFCLCDTTGVIEAIKLYQFFQILRNWGSFLSFQECASLSDIFSQTCRIRLDGLWNISNFSIAFGWAKLYCIWVILSLLEYLPSVKNVFSIYPSEKHHSSSLVNKMRLDISKNIHFSAYPLLPDRILPKNRRKLLGK